ncbi:MAG: phosphoglucosamine mutase [Coriobacteriia bacterium]|nr:phosphoglucosamine mutase [Coriobacteriia bacterium]
MAHNKLFGTDGIRGVANADLSPELAFRLGFALGRFLADGQAHPRFVIGRDTRRSSTLLQAALTAGIMAAGGDALTCGVLPTPAVAFLVTELQANGGIMITASHNPPEYNGLKVFSREGFKLSDELEARIADALATEPSADSRPTGTGVGRRHDVNDAVERYLAHDIALLTGEGAGASGAGAGGAAGAEAIDGGATDARPLAGLRVAIDCGHGASGRVTPRAFQRLGAEVTAINTDYSGDDINVGCGSTCLGPLCALVQSGSFDLGLAHDGDADRLLAVDETGAVLDGDQIMALVALDLQGRGKLKGGAVVATVMSNLGFVRAMEAAGIEVLRTQVGDRYVLERMRADGLVVGGEQSGHIIFLEHNTTGDGLLSALMLARIMAKAQRPLSVLSAEVMQHYPQVLVNVAVTDREGAADNAAIAAAVAAVEAELGNEGRVLLRASGTEPLVRVMVEASDEDRAHVAVERLVAVVQAELG